MKHKVSLGKSNFKGMIENKNFYIDKSLFVKEVVEEGSEVVLITRPRRFGKSLNFSMLKYFFDIKEDSRELFKGLKISREEESLKHMNKYPVVDIDFKGIDGDNWEGVKRGIYTRISELYSRYWEEVREVIDEEEKKIYKQIIKREPWDVDIVLSLKRLIEYLERRYKEKVIVLIDEYDAVMVKMYGREGFESCMRMFKLMYENALKGNDSLHKALMTGIMRVAKEGMFSGLNNVSVYTVLSERFSKHFGFLEEEIEDVLKEEGLSLEETKKYYNGYKFGNNLLYNPWSITNLLYQKDYGTYWINTGLGAKNLIMDSLPSHNDVVGKYLEKLIEGGSVISEIPEGISLQNLRRDEESFWSLMLYSGYLTKEEKLHEMPSKYSLKIPNREVESFYMWILKELSREVSSKNIMELLIENKSNEFEEKLNEAILKGISYYENSELFYHGLMYAMSKTLNDYEVLSNVESGNGRPDIMIEGKGKGIIEIKRAESDLKKSSKEAIEQIKEKRYWERLGKEVKEVKLVRLSFKSKEAKILVEDIAIS